VGSAVPVHGMAPATKNWDSGKGIVLAVVAVVLDYGVGVDGDVLVIAAVAAETDEPVVAQMAQQ